MSEPERRVGVHRSVFAKLLAIMLTMALSLLLLVGGFFACIVSPNLDASVDRLVAQYGRVVATTSPDRETARRLVEGLDLEIRYEGANGSWSTAEGLPSLEDVRSAHVEGWSHFHRSRSYYVVPAAQGTYLFVSNFGGRMHQAHQTLVLLLLVVVGVVVIVAHAVLRRLLRPLRSLGDGVAQLGEGRLDVVLPERTRDEFGQLTAAFNRMAARVRERIRARDQLLLDVSHELRSPLTRMKVALELLPEGDKRTRMAADVAEMEAMVTELLELERLRDGGALHLTRRDLVALLREAAAAIQDQAPGVRVDPAAPAILLDLDGDKVRTVLRNLLENAVKYALPDSRAIEIRAAEHGDTVVVRVSDDGPGIPEPDLASVFEPFFRVDPSRSKKTGGFGLGLSLCKRIMEAHGGAIAVENNRGRGACFVLTFPRSAPGVAPPSSRKPG